MSFGRAGAVEWWCQASALEREEQEVEMQEAGTPQALSNEKESNGVVVVGTYVGAREICVGYYFLRS